jgi:hypothetical protein
MRRIKRLPSRVKSGRPVANYWEHAGVFAEELSEAEKASPYCYIREDGEVFKKVVSKSEMKRRDYLSYVKLTKEREVI